MTSTTENFLSLAAATASFVDVDLNRKTRVDAIQWREEDLAFIDEQRSWHELAMQHRREDMNFRRQEIEQRNLVNRRREIDEKNEQLKNIANISALIAGFCVIVLIELNFEREDVPDFLLSVYACFSALTVCLMTYAYVTCTLILVGTLKKFEVFASYDDEDKFFQVRRSLRFNNDGTAFGQEVEDMERQDFQKTRFMLFWENTCEGDWNRAYMAFSLGVPCFLASIVFAAWMKFLPLLVPGIIVSILCGCTIIFLFWDAHMKWGVFLASSSKKKKKGESEVEENPRGTNSFIRAQSRDTIISEASHARRVQSNGEFVDAEAQERVPDSTIPRDGQTEIS